MTSGDDLSSGAQLALAEPSAAALWVPSTELATRRTTTAARRPATAPPPRRWSRRRGVLGAFAAFAAVGFVAAYVGPTGVALTEASAQERAPISLYTSTLEDSQSFAAGEAAGDAAAIDLGRSGYSVYVTPSPTPTPAPAPAAAESDGEDSSGSTASEESPEAEWAPPFITPDPGTAQAIAYEMVVARGWGDGEFACLVALWNRESGWRVNAYNAGSGAYGIPQSLPGNKMASAGADWETNPATQISWGLGYIGGRYGSPCGAWSHSENVGWY